MKTPRTDRSTIFLDSRYPYTFAAPVLEAAKIAPGAPISLADLQRVMRVEESWQKAVSFYHRARAERRRKGNPGRCPH